MLLDGMTPDQRFRLGKAAGKNPLVCALVCRAMNESMSAHEFTVVLAEHMVRAIEASGNIAYDLAKLVHDLKQPCQN